MATTQVHAESFFRNLGREAARVECELARRLLLLGIHLDDRAAIRRLFDSAYLGKVDRQRDSMTSDLLGLGLILVKLVRQSSSAGSDLQLEPATRAFVNGVLGTRSANH